MIRLNVSLSRKVGLPDFGSVGASLSLEFEADSAMLSDPAAFRTYVETHYELVGSLVDAELARQTGQQPAAAAAQNGTTPPPSRRPQVATPRTVNGQHRNGGATKHVQGGPPRDGKQLFAWARRNQEEGSAGLIDWLVSFGKSQGYPAKITTWDSVQTAEALAEVMQGAS